MNGRRRIGWNLVLAGILLASAMSITPAAAGGKKDRWKDDRFQGGSNPTNVAVVDSDLDFCVSSSGGLDGADEQMGVPDSLLVATGRGVTVAVLDGGFNLLHPDVEPNVSPHGYDAIDGDFDPSDYGNGIDDNGDGITDAALGHGTFVSGMILRVAPDATILPIRVRDDEGYGSNEELAAGLEWAIAMDVDVINLSITPAECAASTVPAALWEADRRGIHVVVSAGNDGADTLPRLARESYVTAAGAVDGYDRIAPFSNYQEKKARGLLIFAPGVDLYGPMGFPEWDSYGFWSGTSFSAGFVSGAVAVALELSPEADPDDVRKMLGAATDPVYDFDGGALEHAGRIDLAKLVSGAAD